MIRALAIALALSITGNALLAGAWLSARDKARSAAQSLAGAQHDATACSAAVEGLQSFAMQRLKDATTARKAAEQQARKAAQRADKTLATAPAVPGDMCASMQVLGDGWLKGRAAP